MFISIKTDENNCFELPVLLNKNFAVDKKNIIQYLDKNESERTQIHYTFCFNDFNKFKYFL